MPVARYILLIAVALVVLPAAGATGVAPRSLTLSGMRPGGMRPGLN